jgi:hypothetical protein
MTSPIEPRQRYLSERKDDIARRSVALAIAEASMGVLREGLLTTEIPNPRPPIGASSSAFTDAVDALVILAGGQASQHPSYIGRRRR